MVEPTVSDVTARGLQDWCADPPPRRSILFLMSTPLNSTKTTAAFFAQSAIAFGVSFLGLLFGICYLPLDMWQRLFLAMAGLFLVSSTFGLAKTVRDMQEASTVRVRIDEARIDRLLNEHDPLRTFTAASS